jgi:predicted nucleotidyltransferase
MQFSLKNAPDEIRGQLEQFVNGCHHILGEDLTGLYLHGSLAMGCFNPQLSDLDLLVLSERRLTQQDKALFAEMMLTLSRNPSPIEMSVLARERVFPWQHPAAFEFHYSESWREKLEAGDLDQPETDDDLAAHVVIARERGITLYGQPARQLLPEVPTDDYVDALLFDFDEARDKITESPVYSVLNLCRVYWFLLKNAISSKDEAGEWAQLYLPEVYRPVVSKALRGYRGNGEVRLAAEELRSFAAYIDEQVRDLLS